MRPLLILLSLIPHFYVAAVGLQEAGPSGFLLGLLVWNVVPVSIGALAAYSKFWRYGVGWLLATLVSSTWAVWVGLLPEGVNVGPNLSIPAAVEFGSGGAHWGAARRAVGPLCSAPSERGLTRKCS